MGTMYRRLLLLQNASESDSSTKINVDNYLTIEALEDGLTASLSRNVCEYCVDGDGNWKTLAADTATESINTGHTLSFKGELTPVFYQGIGTFTINKKCNLKGNCMSMLFGDEGKDNFNLYYLVGNSYSACHFYGLFEDCATIKSVSEDFLPALTLSPYCYDQMFKGCQSLQYAPKLPATTLTTYCYCQMFYNCKALTTAPELPATKLSYGCYSEMMYNTNLLPDCTNIDFTKGDGSLCGLFSGTPIDDNTLKNLLPINSNGHYCLPAEVCGSNGYNSMFKDCKNLVLPPDILATEIGNQGCFYMFAGCTSLIRTPKLQATKIDRNGYSDMFYNCTSLVEATELPAISINNSCYSGMFKGCKLLKTSPTILPATELYDSCYYGMFDECNSLITTPQLPATILAGRCYEYMFEDCKNLTTAPELPAATLEYNCYNGMFKGCNKLNYIKMLATDISAYGCLNNWVNGVASSGTFVKHPDMTTLPTGISGIPEGWTVVNDGEESGKEINFYIADHWYNPDYIEYTALEGMTWENWVNSEYNIDNYIFGELGIKNNNNGYTVVYQGDMIHPEDTIIANNIYDLTL